MAKILLIDDDAVLLKLYSTRLANDNHEISTASNGEEGLRLIQDNKPDVIILDLLMPKMNGFKFLETIKKNEISAQIPIIVFSSVANNEQIQRLNQLGVTIYLNKIDTTPTQLVSVIESQLNLTT